MLRARRAALLAIILLNGCGGDRAAAPAGFRNQTQHSDAQLWSLWQAAQQRLSQQIDLNPLQREFSNAPAQILPGDPDALSVSPRQLSVGPQADVASATLYTATGMDRPDPTGLIACPQPCNVQYAPAYSVYGQPASRYAASWESSESNFDYLVEYEFENQILYAMGYDVSWR